MADQGPSASCNQGNIIMNAAGLCFAPTTGDGAPVAHNSDHQPGSSAEMDKVNDTRGVSVVHAMRIQVKPTAAGALAQQTEHAHDDKVQEVSTDKEDGKESGILQQLRVEVPLAALVTVNSRDAEGTLECQHPDSEPSSPFYDPTKPSLPCYEYVPRRPLSDDMCGSQPYPVLPVTAQAATSEGRQGTQAALTGQQPHQKPTATCNTAQEQVFGLPELDLMKQAMLASLKPKPRLGQARIDLCELQGDFCNPPAHKMPMQLLASSTSLREPTHNYGKMTMRPTAISTMKGTTTGGTSSGSFQLQADGACFYGGVSTSAGLGDNSGAQQHKRARFGATLQEVKYVKKESPVQSLYTADELAQQNTIHDDGGASNHPGPAVHQGNSELQAAGYANEMPGPNQAPCLNAMLRMSPAPHAWASPAMLAAKSKRNKEWRVCSIHGYPTHGSLFEQSSDSLKWLAGITGTNLQPAGSALPPPGPNLVLVVDPEVTEASWLEQDRTGLAAPVSEYLACGAVVVTIEFVRAMHKKAILAKLKYDFWYYAAHDSLFNTGVAVMLSASVLDDPSNDFQVTRICDRIEKLRKYLPTNTICRCYVTQEKRDMLLKQGRLQHQFGEKLLKVLPAAWSQTDARSPVPEVCQQALQALQHHNALKDLRKKAQRHRGGTQYLTLRFMP